MTPWTCQKCGSSTSVVVEQVYSAQLLACAECYHRELTDLAGNPYTNEIARLTAIRDKAAETMRTWHKELTTLREEVINLRELLGNYKGEEDQPL